MRKRSRSTPLHVHVLSSFGIDSFGLLTIDTLPESKVFRNTGGAETIVITETSAIDVDGGRCGKLVGIGQLIPGKR